MDWEAIEQLLEGEGRKKGTRTPGRRRFSAPPTDDSSYPANKRWRRNCYKSGPKKGTPKMPWGRWSKSGGQLPPAGAAPCSDAMGPPKVPKGLSADPPPKQVPSVRSISSEPRKTDLIKALKKAGVDLQLPDDVEEQFSQTAEEVLKRWVDDSRLAVASPTYSWDNGREALEVDLRALRAKNKKEERLSPRQRVVAAIRDADNVKRVAALKPKPGLYFVTMSNDGMPVRFNTVSDGKIVSSVNTIKLSVRADGRKLLLAPWVVKTNTQLKTRAQVVRPAVARGEGGKASDTARKKYEKIRVIRDSAVSITGPEVVKIEAWIDELETILRWAVRRRNDPQNMHTLREPIPHPKGDIDPSKRRVMVRSVSLVDFAQRALRDIDAEYEKQVAQRKDVRSAALARADAHGELVKDTGLSKLSDLVGADADLSWDDVFPKQIGRSKLVTVNTTTRDPNSSSANTAVASYRLTPKPGLKLSVPEKGRHRLKKASDAVNKTINAFFRSLSQRFPWLKLRVSTSNAPQILFADDEGDQFYPDPASPTIIVRKQVGRSPGDWKVHVVAVVKVDPRLVEHDEVHDKAVMLLERAKESGHMHSAHVVRQVAAIVTNSDNKKNWKFSKEFLASPDETLNLAFGTAQTAGKKMDKNPKKPSNIWKLRLAQYEKALEYRNKNRKKGRKSA